MNDKPISDLRRRLIADMTIRTFDDKTQHDYIRHIETFAKFLGRSPVSARLKTDFVYPVNNSVPIRYRASAYWVSIGCRNIIHDGSSRPTPGSGHHRRRLWMSELARGLGPEGGEHDRFIL
jgi:hypothetical protein